MDEMLTVVERILSAVQRGGVPTFPDAIAYDAGPAWSLCRNGEAMIALLDVGDPSRVIPALRACADARRTYDGEIDKLDARSCEAIQRVFADAVRVVCPQPPSLSAILERVA